MRDLAIQLAIGFGCVVLLALSKVTILYRISPRRLVIRWLGIPVRWVRLTNIVHIGLQRTFWAERWINSFSPGNRHLLIRRRSGLCRNLVISPKNHFVFKAELERARSRLLAPGAPGPLPAPDPPRTPAAAQAPPRAS